MLHSHVIPQRVKVKCSRIAIDDQKFLGFFATFSATFLTGRCLIYRWPNLREKCVHRWVKIFQKEVYIFE